MPKESLSVYFDGVDHISPVLSSLADKTRALDKDSQMLQQTYIAMQNANKSLIAQRTELKVSLETQKNKVSELRAEYKKYGDDMSGLNMKLAIEEQDDLKDKLEEVEDQLKANRKAFNENRETIRKGLLENDFGEDGGTSLNDNGGDGGTSLRDVAKGIFAGQIGQMFASSLSGLGQAALTSAIGAPEASLISDTLSGIISGGAAGAVFGLPGIAAGAALGGASGLISGGTRIFEAKDDAFKDYYGGLYDDVKGLSGDMVEAGSTIAGGREQTRMAFSQRLGGDDRAAAYLAQVEKMAASTNYEYDEIVGYAKLLLNSYDPGEVFGVLRDLSDATAGLDLSSSDVNMMISGLSRMRTTGKATQEYLNYFRERGVDVDQALADSLNVNKSSIAKMVTGGKISGEDAAQAILDFIQQEFGGLSDTLAGTFDAMVDNLGDMESSIRASGGDAYNSLRKSGISAQQEAYEGDLGGALKEINAILGENQARRENLQDQYMREVLDAVLNGKQGSLWAGFNESQRSELMEMSQKFAELSQIYEDSGRTDVEAGAQLEALYERAQSLGQAYYDNSGLVQMLNDTELDEIEAIRQATVGLGDAYTALYDLNQTMSKGLVVRSENPVGEALASAGGALSNWMSRTFGGASDEDIERIEAGRLQLDAVRAQVRGHAYGLSRVPYDEYPALLHEGERVLTASEARAQDAGGAAPISITFTGNTFTGTPEDMAYELAQLILQRLSVERNAAAPK